MANQFGELVKTIHRNDYDLEFYTAQSGHKDHPENTIITIMMITYFGRRCYEYFFRNNHPEPRIVYWLKQGIDTLIEYKKEYDQWIRTQPNKDPDIIFE